MCSKELPRSGRPRKLTIRDESCIFRKVRINPKKSYRQLASDLSSKFPNVSVNKDTKPLLTALDRLKRLKRCKERNRLLKTGQKVFIKRFSKKKYQTQVLFTRVIEWRSF
ncbi:hypothetical protein BpHYR1_020098, partial [Brachionus plicatilis]